MCSRAKSLVLYPSCAAMVLVRLTVPDGRLVVASLRKLSVKLCSREIPSALNMCGRLIWTELRPPALSSKWVVLSCRIGPLLNASATSLELHRRLTYVSAVVHG